MKLGSKLLAAPLLTAVVVFSVGQLNSWLGAREAAPGTAPVHWPCQRFEAGGLSARSRPLHPRTNSPRSIAKPQIFLSVR